MGRRCFSTASLASWSASSFPCASACPGIQLTSLESSGDFCTRNARQKPLSRARRIVLYVFKGGLRVGEEA